MPAAFGSNPWDCHCNNLRRMWAAFTLSKDCIMEEFTVPGFSFDVGSPPDSVIGDPSLMQDFMPGNAMENHRGKSMHVPLHSAVNKSLNELRKSDALLRASDPQATWPMQQRNYDDHYQQHQPQLYQSRIPTPMSSPRPIRARRGSLKSAAAVAPDATNPVPTSYLSSSFLPSPTSSTTPSSPEKECSFLRTPEPLKPKDMVRISRTKSASPGKVSPSPKAGCSQRRSASSSRRSSSTTRSSSSSNTTAVSSSDIKSCSKTNSTRDSTNNGREGTKGNTISGRDTNRLCSRIITKGSMSTERDSTRSLGRNVTRSSTSIERDSTSSFSRNVTRSSTSRDRDSTSICSRDGARSSTSRGRDSTSSCGTDGPRSSTSSSDTLSPSSPASSSSGQTVMSLGRGRGARPKASAPHVAPANIITTTFCANCGTLSKSRSPSSSSSSSRDRGSNTLFLLCQLWRGEWSVCATLDADDDVLQMTASLYPDLLPCTVLQHCFPVFQILYLHNYFLICLLLFLSLKGSFVPLLSYQYVYVRVCVCVFCFIVPCHS